VAGLSARVKRKEKNKMPKKNKSKKEVPQRYVIVDVHPSDQFYPEKNELVGRYVSPSRNTHKSPHGDDYLAGSLILDDVIVISGRERKDLYFYAVKVQIVSNDLFENGQILRLE
jgi:hypothetical protein